MSLLKLASTAVKVGSTASKHLGTANKLLNVAQQQADKHLAGTDIHKKLATKIAVAQSHVNTAQNLATQLQKAPTMIAVKGGAKRTNRRTNRRTKRKSSSRKSTKSRYKRSRKS